MHIYTCKLLCIIDHKSAFMYLPYISLVLRAGYLVNLQIKIGYKCRFLVLREEKNKICGQFVFMRNLEAVKLRIIHSHHAI
jgi:hypothetical protein